MRISDLPAYKRINLKFQTGEFQEGNVIELPIYSYEKGMKGKLTPGHYVSAIAYGKIHLKDIPKECCTREFFVHALSGVHRDVLDYVKEHVDEEFDREFFKDHIATDKYALEFEENCFEYMPLEYIDEEMVSCAMLKAVGNRYVERRGDFDDWFYSVAKRKPEVLTQDFWTLGARLFATKRGGKNKFLEITPKQYQTEEYYFAMCLANDTPVMEDFPENIITTKFLIALINDSVKNIKSFSSEALERKVAMSGQSDQVKFWQAAIILDGYLARDIPLNDERVAFFFDHYDKDSGEYQYGFKDSYKRWLDKKNESQRSKLQSKGEDAITRAANLTIAGALLGVGVDNAIDIANADLKANVNHSILLPIRYKGCVPKEFCKKYDQEEYLEEIYKKLGIEILGKHDYYYHEVILPHNLSVEEDAYGNYCVKTLDGITAIKYRDVGPFYDRSVYVSEINISL